MSRSVSSAGIGRDGAVPLLWSSKAALGCCRTPLRAITRPSVRVVLAAEGAWISLALDQVQHHTFRARPSP